jgi:hypothetical protein
MATSEATLHATPIFYNLLCENSQPWVFLLPRNILARETVISAAGSRAPAVSRVCPLEKPDKSA